MKIAYTSDIHSDITLNNNRLVPYLARRISQINPDVFVIAGDVSNSLENLSSTLKQFGELKCLKVMVPGNHDIWIESNKSIRKGKDSFYKYREAIPQICSENGFIYPINEPYTIGNTAIVGSIGWYDYSLADERLKSIYSFKYYADGVFNKGTWNDTKYAVWLKSPESTNWRERTKAFSNKALFEMIFDELYSNFMKLPDNIEKVLFVLHTAPYKECIISEDEPSPFDAYEGSTRIGELLNEISKNRKVYVVCGHRHRKMFLDKGSVLLYRSPVGYLDSSQTDYEKIAENAIGEFEI